MHHSHSHKTQVETQNGTFITLGTGANQDTAQQASKFLKNADSTSERTYSDNKYWLTANTGSMARTDSTTYHGSAGLTTGSKGAFGSMSIVDSTTYHGSAGLTTGSKGTFGTMSIVDSVAYSKAANWDTTAFTTTGLRVALYEKGMTTTGSAAAFPRYTTDITPTAADVQLAAWCKPDSIIIHRISSGTSGLKISVEYAKKATQ